MRIFLIDARDKISSVDPTPCVFVQPSNFFSSPQPLSSPAPTSFMTTKIDHIRSIASSAGIITFTELLKVLRHIV